MVAWLAPVAAAIGGSVLGGAVAGFLGGSDESKKTQTLEQAQTGTTIQPYGIYAPQRNLTYTYNPANIYEAPSVIIDSPFASVSKKTTATPTSTQTITPTTDIAVPTTNTASSAAGMTEGTDFVKLAVIGAVALVAYGLVSK